MLLLKAWADQNLEYDYIKYPVDKRNIASRKIPEALGGAIAGEKAKTSRSGRKLLTLEYHVPRVA